MAAKVYILVNVPKLPDLSDYLTDFLEAELNCSVSSIKSHPGIPDRVLIVLEDELSDLKEVNDTLAKAPLENAIITLAAAIRSSDVIILDRRQYSHFETYLETDEKGGKSIVLGSFPIPESETIAACITSAQALESLMEKKSMVQEVGVEPFYENFHGCIPSGGGMTLLKNIETRKESYRQIPRLSNDDVDACHSTSRPELLPKPNLPKQSKVFPKPKQRASLERELPPVFPKPRTSPVRDDYNKPPKEHYSTLTSNEHKSNFASAKNFFNMSSAPSDFDERNKPMLPKKSPAGSILEVTMNPQSVTKSTIPKEKIDGENRKDETIQGNVQNGQESVEEEESDGLEAIGNSNHEYVREDSESRESSTKIFSSKKRMTLRSSPKPQQQQEQEQNLTKQESVEVDQHHWNLVQSRFNHPDVEEISYDDQRQLLKIKGHDMPGIIQSLEDLKVDIIEGSPLKIPDNLKKVFQRLERSLFCKTYLTELLKKHSVQCLIKDDSVCFYGWDADKINKTKEEFQNRFMHSIEIDNGNGMSVGQVSQEMSNLMYEYLVDISWTDSHASEIQVIGVYDDVTLVQDHFAEKISRYASKQSNFEFLPEHSLFIEKHCQHSLSNILRDVIVNFQGIRDSKYCIEYTGIGAEISRVTRDLSTLMGSIRTESINISRNFESEIAELISKALIHMKEGSQVHHLLNFFQNDERCCIIHDVKTQNNNPTAQAGKETSQAQAAAPVSHNPSPTLSIQIKANGNIVKEAADVLVCVLHETKILKRLSISKAFKQAIPDLQDKVNELDFSVSKVQFLQIPADASEVKCKFIAFIIVSPFDDDKPQDSIQQLILEVLMKAAQSKAESVTFPPIGLGVVLKYPPESVSGQYFLAFKDFESKTSSTNLLKEITILACDQKFFPMLQKELVKHHPSMTEKSKEKNSNKRESETVLSSPTSCISTATLKIIHAQDRELASSLIGKLRQIITEDKCSTNKKRLPKTLEKNLQSKVKNMVLVMTKCKDEADDLVFVFKGLHEDILKIKDFISQELLSRADEPTYIMSEHTPPRGTIDFLKYAVEIDEKTPPYWKHRSRQNMGNDMFREESVDDKTRDGIKAMFLNTYDSSATGKGNDAKGIPPNSTMEFVDVKRLENPAKFKLYSEARKLVLDKKVKEGEICKTIGQVSARQMDCIISAHMPDHMKEQLCHEVNETYLLHGTKPEIVKTIKTLNFDPTVGSAGAMFGKGIYAAECSTKSDQYTDSPGNRLPRGSFHYAFLLRILLGDIFVCDHNHPTTASKDCEKLLRPPCKICQKDRCTCAGPMYDSVMGEGKWIFREFVVYRDYHCYPEYIIKYKRN